MASTCGLTDKRLESGYKALYLDDLEETDTTMIL